jgi:hypothetical protein
VIRQAALANVAIYTVDPRGLRAPGGASVASRGIGPAFASPGLDSAGMALSMATRAKVSRGDVDVRARQRYAPMSDSASLGSSQ